jgi:hypothetical protein
MKRRLKNVLQSQKINWKKQQEKKQDRKNNQHCDLRKKILEQYGHERGNLEASIIVEIEQLLEKFDASRAAYHGGNFNGVACRRIVGNANKI